MRILYLHQYFCPPGGSGNNRSYELARAWTQAGHEVTIFTSPAYFPDSYSQDHLVNEFEVDGIQVVVLKVDYAHEMSFMQRVQAWLKFFRKARPRIWKWTDVDLVYASSTPPTIGELGRRIFRRKGIPFVFETVDVWPDVPIGMGILKNKILIRFIQRRTNRIYREAVAIVALSEGMKEQVLTSGINPGKVHVVHNGTNPEAFPYIERPPRKGALVIYTGTVGIANGLDHLVDAAAEIDRLGRKDISFVIVGQGNDLARVKAYAASMDLSNLSFRSRVPKEEVPQLLASADIGCVCFASHAVLEANSANKFYDYLSAGLPVVLNYEGWQADYLAAYGGGLATEQGNKDQFVKNILQLADHPERRIREGERGRKMVEEYFDRRILANRLLELFEEVLA